MRFESLTEWRRTTAVVAVAACLLVSVLAWVGYVAVQAWQRSVVIRAEREAEEAAGLLVSGLTRDMRAVQRSILSSPALDAVTLQPPHEYYNIVAGAFARYQYPESFVWWQRDTDSPSQALLLHRRDRPPAWAMPDEDLHRFPLRPEQNMRVVQPLLNRIAVDARQARRFSVFETTIDGSRYQIVARLFYGADRHQEPKAILGFTINLEWVQQHYFALLLSDAAWTSGARADVLLTVTDEQGRPVTDTGGRADARSALRVERRFPLMFFNPQLIAADPPPDLPRRSWTVEAAIRDDSSLVAAIDAGDRMLILQAITAAALALAIVLTLRASRAKLRLADLQADFVSSVTHEFKTPIATIKAAGESLAAGRIDGPAAKQEYAAYIVQEARRLSRLVDNLLSVSRVTDTGPTQHQFEPVALAELVAETLERFAVPVAEGKFTVCVDVPANLPLIAGNASALELMLDNLIDNAIRHSRTARRLEIRAAVQQDNVIFDVIDFGGGIDEDELPHVMRKFYRGRNAGAGGTGLGLAIANRIITEHGGTMTIRSRPGCGTTVTVTVPALPNGEAETLPSLTSAAN
jgi:signal transduction histidine kinase